MSYHFFLSYSRADGGPLLKRFFDDLSDSIRIELNLPRTHSVGFYEETKYGRTLDWSDAAKEALQDSGMMICLLSPAYLHCEHAGKEWQIFEMRWRRTLEGLPTDGSLPASLAHVIVPVTWKPWYGPVPKVVDEMLAHPDHIHQREALMTTLRSSGISRGEYAEFVKTLANQIIEMAPVASKIRPLDPLPKMSEVHSAFHLWDEAAIATQFKPPAVPVSEPLGASSSSPQEGSNSTSWKKTHTGKYSVIAVSKEEEILDRCCPSSVFDVRKYKNADKARQELESLFDDDKDPPNLLIIDLDFDQPEIESTMRLSEKMRLPSEILLLSDVLP